METDKSELFLGSDGNLYHPTANHNQLRGLRAYFKVPATGNGVRLLIDDNATDIANIITSADWSTASGNHHLYNLNGQRVAEPRKGLYISNGRKIIIH